MICFLCLCVVSTSGYKFPKKAEVLESSKILDKVEELREELEILATQKSLGIISNKLFEKTNMKMKWTLSTLCYSAFTASLFSGYVFGLVPTYTDYAQGLAALERCPHFTVRNLRAAAHYAKSKGLIKEIPEFLPIKGVTFDFEDSVFENWKTLTIETSKLWPIPGGFINPEDSTDTRKKDSPAGWFVSENSESFFHVPDFAVLDSNDNLIRSSKRIMIRS